MNEAQTEYRRTSLIGNLIRGALMGAAETVPGISGGTVALVVGIYQQIIDSAGSVISAVRVLITGPDRLEGAKADLRHVYWGVIIPVLVGMVLALFTVAGPMVHLMETYPVRMRALFFGMVLASVAVPVRMLLRDLELRRLSARAKGEDVSHLSVRPKHAIFGAIAAVAAFLLVSLPPTTSEPSAWVLIPAAMAAVSALVLPGLSGSFILLTFGLYESTMRAVSELDLGYISLFMVGILIGMVVVVKALQWLLQHHHTSTLAVLTGVMLGGLRTLWPWQDAARHLSGPGNDLWVCLGLAAVGFGAISLLVWIDARATRKQDAQILERAAE